MVASELFDRSIAAPAGDRVRVGAGVPLSELQRTLAAAGLYYPPVPTFDGAFVGGTIATNAAGAATFKYGSTRAWVEGLTVVLASGDVLDVTRGETLAGDDGRMEIDRVLSVSSRLGERMGREIGFPVNRIQVIRNGVDVDRFNPRHRTEARISFGFRDDDRSIDVVQHHARGLCSAVVAGHAVLVQQLFLRGRGHGLGLSRR